MLAYGLEQRQQHGLVHLQQCVMDGIGKRGLRREEARRDLGGELNGERSRVAGAEEVEFVIED